MNVRDTENGGILDGNEFRYVFSVAEFSTADDDDPESERDGRARKGNKKKEKRSIIFRASGRIRGGASRSQRESPLSAGTRVTCSRALSAMNSC